MKMKECKKERKKERERMKTKERMQMEERKKERKKERNIKRKNEDERKKVRKKKMKAGLVTYLKIWHPADWCNHGWMVMVLVDVLVDGTIISATYNLINNYNVKFS